LDVKPPGTDGSTSIAIGELKNGATGDAMLAGVIAGKIEKRALMECTRLATVFSVVVVTHILAGLPERSALAKIEDDVKLYSLDS